MADERSRYGLMVSALGAIVLAISVFLPWYGLSFTASGLAAAQQAGQQAIAEYGNPALQSYSGTLHASLSGLAGHEFTALSAHQALKYMNIVLLVLAGLALADLLLALARTAPANPAGAGASAILLGAVAVVCVVFRMVDRPVPVEGAISLSLREGSWLALLGASAVVLGGMWPRVGPAASAPETSLEDTWSGLSGWTPQP